MTMTTGEYPAERSPPPSSTCSRSSSNRRMRMPSWGRKGPANQPSKRNSRKQIPTVSELVEVEQVLPKSKHPELLSEHTPPPQPQEQTQTSSWSWKKKKQPSVRRPVWNPLLKSVKKNRKTNKKTSSTSEEEANFPVPVLFPVPEKEDKDEEAGEKVELELEVEGETTTQATTTSTQEEEGDKEEEEEEKEKEEPVKDDDDDKARAVPAEVTPGKDTKWILLDLEAALELWADLTGDAAEAAQEDGDEVGGAAAPALSGPDGAPTVLEPPEPIQWIEVVEDDDEEVEKTAPPMASGAPPPVGMVAATPVTQLDEPLERVRQDPSSTTNEVAECDSFRSPPMVPQQQVPIREDSDSFLGAATFSTMPSHPSWDKMDGSQQKPTRQKEQELAASSAVETLTLRQQQSFECDEEKGDTPSPPQVQGSHPPSTTTTQTKSKKDVSLPVEDEFSTSTSISSLSASNNRYTLPPLSGTRATTAQEALPSTFQSDKTPWYSICDGQQCLAMSATALGCGFQGCLSEGMAYYHDPDGELNDHPETNNDQTTTPKVKKSFWRWISPLQDPSSSRKTNQWSKTSHDQHPDKSPPPPSLQRHKALMDDVSLVEDHKGKSPSLTVCPSPGSSISSSQSLEASLIRQQQRRRRRQQKQQDGHHSFSQSVLKAVNQLWSGSFLDETDDQLCREGNIVDMIPLIQHPYADQTENDTLDSVLTDELTPHSAQELEVVEFSNFVDVPL